MINWEVVIWTCITLGVMMGIFGLIISIISAVNMKKRRKQVGEIHTTLQVGSKILFAVVFIGVVTFILSAIGVKIGNLFGMKFKSKAELFGGVILILMGLKIFLEDLGIIDLPF